MTKHSQSPTLENADASANVTNLEAPEQAVGNAADRLAVESVQDRPQVLGRILGRYRGAPGERREDTGEALTG